MKMKSKTQKFITLALAIAVLAPALLFAGLDSAVPGDAKDLRGSYWTERHRYIAFGEYGGEPIIWRILEIGETDEGEPMAFLLADGYVEEYMEFDGSSNDWNSSDIKRWLNDDFYHAAFSEKERGAIVNSSYYYGGKYKGSDRKDTSKVFLLSVDDAENQKFFANDADRALEGNWWLRSPVRDVGNAANVLNDGGVYGIGVSVRFGYTVRPALKINLASSIFTSPSSKYEVLYPVTVKVSDEVSAYPICGAAVATDSPKQKYFTENEGEALLKLGVGQQTIQVSVVGSKTREITLDVEPGTGITVDLKVEKTATLELLEFLGSLSGIGYEVYGEPALDLEETKRLIAAGADVNARNTCGATPLMLVLLGSSKWKEPDSEIIKALIEAGADVNARCPDDGRTPLMSAARDQCAEAAEVLLRAGADANARNTCGVTALMMAQRFAMTSGRWPHEISETLIAFGADVNAKDNRGRNVLFYAFESFDPAFMMPVLLDHGADVNAQDAAGRTALMEAVSAQENLYTMSLNAISLLLDAGADVNIRDAEGRRALDYVRNYRNYEEFTKSSVFKIIEEKTAD
jgi:ankyrin repeat protein